MPGPIAPAPVVETTIPIRTPEGRFGRIPQSQVKDALANGASISDDATVRRAEFQQQNEARYGGVGGGIAAAGLGALRGATVGLSDSAITGIGGESARQYVEGVQSAHPEISTAGELAGAIAPAFVGDEAGLLGEAGRAITAPSRAVTALGGLAERGAARVVGEGAAGLGARVLQRGAAAGVRGATEGALYGLGHQVSEDAIHDHQTTAESLIAAAGEGARFGGLFGGGLGALGEVAGTTASRLGKLGSDLTSSAVGRKEGETLEQFLDRSSGEVAFRSAGGTQNMTAQADKYAGGADAVGKIWRDEVPALVGKDSFATLTRDDLVQGAGLGMKREAGRIDTLVDTLDSKALNAGLRPRALDLVNQVDALTAEVAKKAGTRNVQAKLNSFSDDIKKITGLVDANGEPILGAQNKTISYKQLLGFRKDADALWSTSKTADDLRSYQEQFFSLRNIVENSIEKDGGKLGGTEWLKEYVDAKRKWQAFKMLDKASSKGVAREGTNRAFGLSDNIIGSSFGNAGATIGTAIGGPVGGFVGGALGGAAGFIGNKLVRKHADFLVAEGLKRASRIGGLEEATRQVTGRVGRAVSGLFNAETGARAAQIISKRPLRERRPELEASIREVQDLATNPTKLMDHTASRIGGGLGADAPKTAAAASQVLAKGITFLASKTPKGIGTSSVLFPGEKRHFTDSELSEYGAYHDAVHHPLATLDEIEHGHVTREGAETLREIYPKLYQHGQLKILDELQKLEAMHSGSMGLEGPGGKGKKGKGKKGLPYSRKLAVGTLMNIAADATMEPQFMASIQATKEAPQDSAPTGKMPARNPGRPMHSPDTATLSDKLSA